MNLNILWKSNLFLEIMFLIYYWKSAFAHERINIEKRL